MDNHGFISNLSLLVIGRTREESRTISLTKFMTVLKEYSFFLRRTFLQKPMTFVIRHNSICVFIILILDEVFTIFKPEWAKWMALNRLQNHAFLSNLCLLPRKSSQKEG